MVKLPVDLPKYLIRDGIYYEVVNTQGTDLIVCEMDENGFLGNPVRLSSPAKAQRKNRSNVKSSSRRNRRSPLQPSNAGARKRRTTLSKRNGA